MQADGIATAEQFIRAHPSSPDSKILARLLHGLRGGEHCDVHELYELDVQAFELAMEILAAWRLQRYYRGRAIVAGAALRH